MSTHTKVNEEVYAEYECSLGDCGHDTCPTLRLDICQECTREAWEQHEGGAVTWTECLENLALDEFDRPETKKQGDDHR